MLPTYFEQIFPTLTVRAHMPTEWDRLQGVSLFYINYQLRHSSMGQLAQIIAQGSQIIYTNFNPLCF